MAAAVTSRNCWLDRIQKAVETTPANESEFIGEMMSVVDTTKFVAGDYDL